MTAQPGETTPDWYLEPVRTRDLVLALDGERVRARLYVPQRASPSRLPPGVVLLHGVHPEGIDEARLSAFARALSATGLSVLTPRIPELLDYRLEPRTIDRIGAIAQRHAALVRQRRVGVIGISFAGGLALIAAARQGEHAAMRFVVAVGAHHDLRRLARHYAGCPVRGPDGDRPTARPNAFGLRVIVAAHAEHFFDERDAEPARRAIRLRLEGQSDAASSHAARLTPGGRALLSRVFDDRCKRRVGARLLRAVDENRQRLAEASPRGQLDALRVPVYLVHGEADPVIPSIETRWLAREVPEPFLREALVTPVLSHTDLSAARSDADRLAVVKLMARILREAERVEPAARGL